MTEIASTHYMRQMEMGLRQYVYSVEGGEN